MNKTPHILSSLPFESIVDKLGEEVLLIDRQATIIYANRIAIKNLVQKKSDLVGQSILKFFKNKISKKKWQVEHFDKISNSREPLRMTIDRIAKKNKRQTIDVTAMPLSARNRDYIVTIARDVTSQIAIERELFESKERYRLLSDQACDGIFTLDLNGYVLYTNPAAKNLIRIPASDKSAKHFLRFIETNSKRKAQAYFEKLIKGKQFVLEELYVVNGFGKVIPMEFAASPNYKNGKIFQFVVICRDISKRKKLEGLLHESDKRRTLNQFIAGTTQEILGPLKGLNDTACRLVKKYQDRPFEYVGYNEFKALLQTLRTMSDQIKYCYTTTNTLVKINKKRVGLHSGCCCFHDVLPDVIRSVEHQLTVNNIKLKTRIASGLPLLAIDSMNCCQILNCILTNAAQSIVREGTIELKASFGKAKENIVVTCKDNGVGISKENLNRVFDPFFTTKYRGLEKSSGLGLAIVYSLVKSAKGNIFIESSMKKGTLVKLIFPVCQMK
ncbi:MAG: PAS domain S-box protein [Candidatus Omnitrophica bacterium]|nr:PAS domain S-box protein [Candidatus Omnitrophota bacterium]